jgi:hypothetical protein
MVTNHAPQTKYCRNIIADSRPRTDPAASFMGAFAP